MVSPKEIGEILKAARQKKDLTIDKIYRATHIQPNIIEALEHGRADEVLNRVYVLLFLKKYTSFLGLDTDNLVANYKAIYTEKEELILDIEKEPLMADIDVQKWIRPALLGASILLLIFFILFLGARIKPRIPPRAIPKEKEEHIQVAKRVFPIPQDKPIELVLKSTDDVWMKVNKDGEVVFQDTLPKNQEKTWTAKNSIDLWVGRAESLKFSVNGTPIEGIGRGRIKSVLISRRGLKIGNKWLLKSED